MKNYKVIAADEEIMKTASDTFFKQFVEWMNSSSIKDIDNLQEAADIVRNEFMQKGDWYKALVASIHDYIHEADGSVPYYQMAVELANRIVGIESDMDSIDNLDLTIRTYVCLKRAGIKTVSQLRQTSAENLLKIKNFSQRSVDEIAAKLENYDF